MNEEQNNEKKIINDCIIYVKKYFDLHDLTVIEINELIKIILNKNVSPLEDLDENGKLDIFIKNELKYDFINKFESLKCILVEIEECTKNLKKQKKLIEDIKMNKSPIKSPALFSLDRFFSKAFKYFKQDYKLKQRLHQSFIHVDCTSENEINRLQLMWKETPFLYLILEKYNVNKLITECKQFVCAK
ncbi:conserved Plasmodium protein, unknown function [Plasmodium vinckei brucechwatti]|uniref:Uncharacterized protein n=1 Tax=Plasmodium vinckei brucechwatti TaxID=119398 RepID=A0A6V7RZG6_PLAVN|nr:conserved Plasmodium protein, unknown function [Plasmodium vinckei brucechwatti]